MNNNISLKIVVAETSVIVRSGLAAVLKRIPNLNAHPIEVSSPEALQNYTYLHTPDIVIVNPTFGGWFDLHNFETWWRRFRKENGFEGLKFHELRHTQATQLLAQGVDVKTVQTRMGHSNASLTLNWYAHAMPQNDRKAADMLGELFADNDEKEERPRLRMVKTA